MKSYTTLRTLYGKYTENTSIANLTDGDEYINDGYRIILGMRAWPFLETSDILLTTALTQFKEIPAGIERIRTATVTVGSTTYTPKEITTEAEWQILNAVDTFSDIPEYFYIRGKQLGLWPIPATSSNLIRLFGKREVKDLSIADYTTGTITTLANGDTSVTGSGTSWTTPMAGRFLRITHSDTANKGDGFWYEISSVASSTSLTLVKAYEGTALSAASAAYTIGQMPILPEAYHVLPVYYAAAEYWDSKTDGESRASKYQLKYAALLKQLIAEYASKSDNVVLNCGSRPSISNPNLFVSSIS